MCHQIPFEELSSQCLRVGIFQFYKSVDFCRSVFSVAIAFFSMIKSGVYILGSTSSMIIDYGIENLGETAYQPRMHITLPETGIAFTKVPSNCKHDVADNLNVMECDLNNGTPLLEGNKTSLRITADTTKLEGTSLKIKAKVYSVSDEQDEKYALEDIRLEEFSNVEISG